jgi:hypothetical protein
LGWDLRRNSLLVKVAHSLYRAGQDDPKLQDHALRLLSCGTWYRKINFGCGTYRLIPCPCNSVFCQRCAARRSKPLIGRILERIDKKKRYWFLTITVRNWSSLTRESLSNLVEQFSDLRESREWKKYVTGGVYSVEAVYNPHQKDGLRWHPHIHVLIETPDRLPGSWIYRLRVLWRRATGSNVLNLQPLYSRDKKGRKTRRIDAKALSELVKYATKASDFCKYPDRVVEFFQAFSSVRRVQTFGNFLGKQTAPEEPIEQEVQEPEELVGCKCGQCKWKDGVPAGLFRERDTFLAPSGFRQLRLFEFDTGPPKEPDPEPVTEISLANQLNLFFEQRELCFSN